MATRTYIAGVGMIPFVKPGANAPYHVMGAEAAKLALADAGLDYGRVQQAYVGYVYGDSTCGQRALYPVGMTGIPIVNVNNNCSTGSTALFLARQAIESGAADCVMALGFEQMKPGALGAVFTDRPSAFDDFDAAADKLVDAPGVPLALRYFGGAGLSHMTKYGTPLSAFAKVRAKASRHAKDNPLALFRKEITADDVMNDQMIWPGVMTRLMACPPTCGGAAAILVSEKFAGQHGLNRQVRIAALVADIEAEAAARRKRTGAQPLGVAAVLVQDPLRRPERTKKSPAPAFHAASQAVRRELRGFYAEFVAAYREAAEKLRAGAPAVFPIGCFPPALPFVGG